jgi:surface antigen
MTAWTEGWKLMVVGTAIAVAPCIFASPAAARSHERSSASHTTGSPHGLAPARVFASTQHETSSVHVYGPHGKVSGHDFASVRYGISHGGYPVRSAVFMSYKHGFSKTGKARYYAHGGYGYGGLQCVPFARAASGIELKGNAALWWDAAAGVYERGINPEPGSVLNFRATGHMRLGHVAVVAAVVNSRLIEIDHANWAGSYGGVSRGVPVEDVSANNDWSEVRVALGRGGEFGSVYPTYGFIYDRPDTGMMASNGNRRPVSDQTDDEVAEAPARPRVFTPARYNR